MKLLIDANLSPSVADGLREAGFDAVHVADLDLVTASDGEIFDRAVSDGLVVVTADSDFGMPARPAPGDESVGRPPPPRSGARARGAPCAARRKPARRSR